MSPVGPIGSFKRAARVQKTAARCTIAAMCARPYRGVFPVAPTIFDDRGELDLDGQRRCIDFMIDAGSQGLCILANFSEQFALTDDGGRQDRKSTRLNSSHLGISYAVFCLK